MKKEIPSIYAEISYTELGNYVGRKAIIQVSKNWLDLLRGEAKDQPTKGTKECSKCKEFLPLNKFNNDKRRKENVLKKVYTFAINTTCNEVTSPIVLRGKSR